MRNYERASRIFKNRWQHVDAKTDRKGNVKDPAYDFVRPFTAREIIADNVASRRPWHAGFAEYLTNRETRIPLQFERKELFQMTQEADYDHPRERVLIDTCHEAWRRRLGQLGERARREHVSFKRLASGEYERQRSLLARCKNAATLRAALTDFWSRAGSLPSLQTNWAEILPLLEEDQWRKARDLALLALASYLPSNSDEQEALTENTPTEPQGQTS
jgi:CRISPR-associated protein Cas8a1/Csx13